MSLALGLFIGNNDGDLRLCSARFVTIIHTLLEDNFLLRGRVKMALAGGETSVRDEKMFSLWQRIVACGLSVAARSSNLISLALISGLFSIGFVQAECQEPLTPEFPQFEANNVAIMDVADQRMQDYIDQTEEYLDCLDDAERKLKIDAVLSRMKQVTAQYNALVTAYRKSKTQELFSETPK